MTWLGTTWRRATWRRVGRPDLWQAYHHPEGNSCIERFHRILKEEEVWAAEYCSLEGARTSIAGWIERYNHDRPHLRNRISHSARGLLGFLVHSAPEFMREIYLHAIPEEQRRAARN